MLQYWAMYEWCNQVVFLILVFFFQFHIINFGKPSSSWFSLTKATANKSRPKNKKAIEIFLFFSPRDVCTVLLGGCLSVWNSGYPLLNDSQQKSWSPTNVSSSAELSQSNSPVYVIICFASSEASGFTSFCLFSKNIEINKISGVLGFLAN